MDVSPRGGIEPHKRKRAPFSPRSRARTRASTARCPPDIWPIPIVGVFTLSLSLFVSLVVNSSLWRPRINAPRFLSAFSNRANALRVRISVESVKRIARETTAKRSKQGINREDFFSFERMRRMERWQSSGQEDLVASLEKIHVIEK